MNDDPQSDLSRIIERAILIFALAAMTAAICLFSCTAKGQEPDGPVIHVEPPMRFADGTNEVPSNAVYRIERRTAQTMIPPLPKKISRTVSTNDQGERVTVTIEKPIDPAPLIQDTPRTNSFWASCPECKVRAIRKPQRIEVVTARAVSGGDELERYIYFRCCRQEFRRKNYKFVEEEIAIEIPGK